MVIFNAIKALIFLPLFFWFGYQLNVSGFLYLILAILVFIGYIGAKLTAQSNPIKAIILFPLLFYFGYRFAGSGDFIYVIFGVLAFVGYIVIKLMTPD